MEELIEIKDEMESYAFLQVFGYDYSVAVEELPFTVLIEGNKIISILSDKY